MEIEQAAHEINPGPAPAEATDIRIGAILGRYKIVRCIGQGGMGTVYLAFDLQRPDRQFALKHFPRKQHKSRGFWLERNEFLSLANLEHPNLMHVYDFGIDRQTGDQFFTSEYVDGINMLEAVKGLKLDLRPDLELFFDLVVQLLRSLEFIHNQGMVYGDIKPENILICHLDHRQRKPRMQPQVKLIDFGLIRFENEFRGKKAWGTPAYVAPETIIGGVIDRRTDLYSLGVLLYQLATGALPFRGKTKLEVLKSHLERMPPPPHAVVPRLPARFSRIILRLMEKKAENRFQNALQVIQEIQRSFKLSISLEVPETFESYLKSARFSAREKEYAKLMGVFLSACRVHEEESDFGAEEEAGQPSSIALSHEPELDIAVPTGRSVLLTGEQGAGKEMLVKHLRCHAQAYGVQFIECECSREMKSEGLQQFLEELLRLCAAVQHRKEAENIQSILAFLRDSRKNGQKAFDRKFRKAFLRMVVPIIEFSNAHPLLLHFKNLHEGDELLFDFLKNLVKTVARRNDPGCRLLIVATSLFLHDVENEDFNELNGSGFLRECFLNIDLECLDKKELRKFLDAAFKDCFFPAELLDRMLERSDGDLRTVMGILRSLLRKNAIQRTTSGWVLRGELDENEFPRTVRRDIQERIAALPDDLYRLAMAFAFMSNVGDPELAIALANLPAAKTRECFDRLLEKKIVRRSNRSNRPQNYILFNASTKDVLYQTVSADKQRSIHELAGKLAEKNMDRLGKEGVSKVAHHFLRSGNREKGLQYGRELARKYEERSDLPRAIDTYEKILDLMDGHTDASGQAYRIRAQLAQLRFDAGNYSGVLELLKNSSETGREAMPPESTRKLCIIASRAHSHLGHFQKSAELLKQAALDAAGKPCPGEEAAMALGHAELHYLQEETVESLRFCERVKEIQADGTDGTDRDSWVRTYLLMAKNQMFLGSSENAANYYQKIVRLMDARQDPGSLDLSLFYRGKYYICRHQYRKALKQFQLCLLLRKESSTASAMAECLLELGALILRMGNPQKAQGYLEQALDLYTNNGSIPGIETAQCKLGEVKRLLGENHSARTMLQETARNAAARMRLRTGGKALLSLSASYYDMGKFKEGDKVFNTAEEWILSTGSQTSAAVEALLLRCDTAWQRGDIDEALGYAAEAVSNAGELKNPVLISQSLRRQGMLHIDIGNNGEARRSLAYLLSTARSHDLLLEEGWGKFLEAMALFSEEKHETAMKNFAQALEMLSEHGSPRDLVYFHLQHGLENMAQHNLEQAYLDIEEGLNMAHRLGLSYMVSWCSLARGLLEGMLPDGRPAKMEEQLLQAERTARQSSYLEPLWQARYHLAGIYEQNGRARESEIYYGKAEADLKALSEKIPYRYRESYRRKIKKGNFARFENILQASLSGGS